MTHLFSSIEFLEADDLEQFRQIATFGNVKLEHIVKIKHYYDKHNFNFAIMDNLWTLYKKDQAKAKMDCSAVEFIDNLSLYAEKYAVAIKLLLLGGNREMVVCLADLPMTEVKKVRKVFKQKLDALPKEEFGERESDELFKHIEKQFKGHQSIYKANKLISYLVGICHYLKECGYKSPLSHLMKTLQYHSEYGCFNDPKGNVYFSSLLTEELTKIYESKGREFEAKRLLKAKG